MAEGKSDTKRFINVSSVSDHTKGRRRPVVLRILKNKLSRERPTISGFIHWYWLSKY